MSFIFIVGPAWPYAINASVVTTAPIERSSIVPHQLTRSLGEHLPETDRHDRKSKLRIRIPDLGALDLVWSTLEQRLKDLLPLRTTPANTIMTTLGL